LVQTYQIGKNVTHDHKLPIPEGHTLYQMAIKYSKWSLNRYTNIFNSKALQNLPKLGFLVSKQTIWQPCLLGPTLRPNQPHPDSRKTELTETEQKRNEFCSNRFCSNRFCSTNVFVLRTFVSKTSGFCCTCICYNKILLYMTRELAPSFLDS
jgi:hypothetical protein